MCVCAKHSKTSSAISVHFLVTSNCIYTMMKPYFKGKTASIKPIYSRNLIHPRMYENTPQLHSLKALCHDVRQNCFLMSSLVQKSNLSGYRKYGHTQHYGIVYGSSRRSNACSAKILLKSSGETCNLQRYGQPKSKNTDK